MAQGVSGRLPSTRLRRRIAPNRSVLVQPRPRATQASRFPEAGQNESAMNSARPPGPVGQAASSTTNDCRRVNQNLDIEASVPPSHLKKRREELSTRRVGVTMTLEMVDRRCKTLDLCPERGRSSEFKCDRDCTFAQNQTCAHPHVAGGVFASTPH